MAKDYRKIYEEQLMEGGLKAIITRLGQYNCIKPDGTLNEIFILSYIVRNHKPTSVFYERLIAAFDALKKDEVFRNFNPKVKTSTLQSLEFYSEYLVRPIKSDCQIDNLFTGTIIKLPKKLASDYFPGESWKSSLEDQFKVGDKILYNCRSNIVLDHECLHLVSYFVGKILESNSNI